MWIGLGGCCWWDLDLVLVYFISFLLDGVMLFYVIIYYPFFIFYNFSTISCFVSNEPAKSLGFRD